MAHEPATRILQLGKFPNVSKSLFSFKSFNVITDHAALRKLRLAQKSSGRLMR